MKPTLHFRWASYTIDIPVGAHGLCIRKDRRELQQFIEIGDDESDITLPKEIGPDGTKGRWMDIPYHQEHRELPLQSHSEEA